MQSILKFLLILLSFLLYKYSIYIDLPFELLDNLIIIFGGEFEVFGFDLLDLAEDNIDVFE
jgi:hypothetical protein